MIHLNQFVFLQIHPFSLVFWASPVASPVASPRTMDHQGLSPGRVPLPNMDPWGHPVPISTFHEWMNYGFSNGNQWFSSDVPMIFQWCFQEKKNALELQYSGGTSWALMASGKPSGPQCESNRRGNWPSDHRDKLRIGCCSPIKTVHLCRKKLFFLCYCSRRQRWSLNLTLMLGIFLHWIWVNKDPFSRSLKCQIRWSFFLQLKLRFLGLYIGPSSCSA